jgi:uncharacterized protein (TIGR01777 family)
MSKILIVGGTGMVGTALEKAFTQDGHEVVLFTRNPKNNKQFLLNYQTNEIDTKAFENVDTLINLAGANVGTKRWSNAYKKEIYDSRIITTRMLSEALNTIPNKIKTVISASAIGIYQNTTSPITEESNLGNDFLAQVCKDWEAEAEKAVNVERRVVIVRIGIVMSKHSGFLPKISTPIKWMVGAALGTGKQMTSMIQLDDLVNIFKYIHHTTSLNGIYNACNNNPVSNKDVTHAIAKKLHRPILSPPIPVFVLKLIFGDFVAELIADKKVIPNRLNALGFQFKYENFNQILDNELE